MAKNKPHNLMFVLCKALESILKRKIKNMKENTKCLYLCQVSPNLGNGILYYDRYVGAASYLSPVRASWLGIYFRCLCGAEIKKTALHNYWMWHCWGFRDAVGHTISLVCCNGYTEAFPEGEASGGHGWASCKYAVLALLRTRQMWLGMWGWTATLSLTAEIVRYKILRELKFFQTEVRGWAREFHRIIK